MCQVGTRAVAFPPVPPFWRYAIVCGHFDFNEPGFVMPGSGPILTLSIVLFLLK